MRLEAPTADRLPAMRRALQAAGLPASDLEPAMLEHFLIGHDGQEVTHCVGVQVVGGAGLLRSLVVAETRRSRGDGTALLSAIEDRMRAFEVDTLYLLTTTAAPFFARHGYRVTDRDDVPAPIRATDEFSTLCPASATCMSKQLQGHAS